MNFFEQELRTILKATPAYLNPTFVGRVCYVRLTDTIRAKIQFITCGTADHYEALQVTILDRNNGQIDTLCLYFRDIFGTEKINNSNFLNNGIPYAWTYNGETEWYKYQPTAEDYKKLAKTIYDYLGLFQE